MFVAIVLDKAPTEQVQLLEYIHEWVYMTATTSCVKWNIIAIDECLLEVVWIVRTWFLVCLDQPNRRMRTRMSGGVGGLPPRGGALSRYAITQIVHGVASIGSK
jgi:hypothetical protein